jgi:hypothetical protein
MESEESKRCFRQLGQFGECGRISNSHIRQYLTINYNAGLLKAMHELTIGQSIHARCRVDSRNPQPPKITLAIPAIPMRVPQRLQHRLIGTPVQGAFRPALTFGNIQNFFMPRPGSDTSFNSGQWMLPLPARTSLLLILEIRC